MSEVPLYREALAPGRASTSAPPRLRTHPAPVLRPPGGVTDEGRWTGGVKPQTSASNTSNAAAHDVRTSNAAARDVRTSTAAVRDARTSNANPAAREGRRSAGAERKVDPVNHLD